MSPRQVATPLLQLFPAASDAAMESVCRPRAMTTLLARDPWSMTVRPGVHRASSVRFSIARCSMSAPVTTEMFSGGQRDRLVADFDAVEWGLVLVTDPYRQAVDARTEVGEPEAALLVGPGGPHVAARGRERHLGAGRRPAGFVGDHA